MAFSLEVWKQEAVRILKARAPLLKQAGTDVLYFSLAAFAFLPAVQSAGQGDAAVWATVATTLGNLGAGLLANLLQRGKDWVDADVAQEILAQAQTNAELRKTLDTLLETLDVVTVTQAALSEADRAWFVAALRTELQTLGSTVQIDTGGGAVIQNNQAQQIIGRDQNNFNYYAAPDADAAQRKRLAEATVAYLRRLRTHCQSLPLAALGADEGSEVSVTLDDVYIELDTTTPDEEANKGRVIWEDEKRPSVLWAAQTTPRLALLGDPGAGKSTFVRKLVGWLAWAQLGQATMPEGFADVPGLPLLMNLRDLAARLNELDVKQLSTEAGSQACLAAFAEEVCSQLGDAELAAGLQRAERYDGLLVLDGLDEVPLGRREVIQRAVRAVLQTWKPRRVILTCRIRSYQQDFDASGFKSFTVSALSREQIDRFAWAWYGTQERLGRMPEERAREQAEDLSRAARAGDLIEMASNPMLLTTMAIIHQKQTRLPDQRVKLYREVIDLLLRRWQQHKQGALAPSPKLAEFLKDEVRLLPTMYRLAYEAHCAGCGKKGAADVGRGEALVLLEDKCYLGDVKLAEEFLDYVDQRAGLLVGRGGAGEKPAMYSFPHRTLQEYLAGCHLLALREGERNRRIEELAEAGQDWALVMQLLGEECYHNRQGKHQLLDLAYWVRGAVGEQQSLAAEWLLLWSGRWTALVGRDAVEVDGEQGRQHLAEMKPKLLRLRVGRLGAAERAEAGDCTDRLGYAPEDLSSLVAIRDEEGRVLFRIGKYPVTNGEYRAFLESGQFAEERYWVGQLRFDKHSRPAGKWGEEGLAWLRRAQRDKDDSPDGVVVYPRWWRDPQFGMRRLGAPVVGMTWWEANAYCRWRSEQLDWGLEGLRLPTEAEWLRAAGGDRPEGRYPWDRGEPVTGEKEEVLKRANAGDAVGRTTVVWQYPLGATEGGVWDLAGNVWEWQANLSGDELDEFALRGGSWLTYEGNVRCALRRRYASVLFFNGLGFRLFSP